MSACFYFIEERFMKMSDVFKLPMVQGSIVLMSNDHRYVIEFDNSYSDVGDQIEHVAHAINNHDRMVEEIAELREFVKTVADGDSASSEAKSFMVHAYIHNAKQLLDKHK